MRRLSERLFLLWLTGLALLIGTLLLVLPARSQDSPRCSTAAPCKVLTLTAEEEQALMGEKQILDSALNARMLDLLGPVLYFRRKIEQAPRGLPQDSSKP